MMADTTVTSTPDDVMIVSEMLCYFQNKSSSVPHDILIKSVADFYSKVEIHISKTLLFKKCKETDMRFKKYNIDSARLDGRDIVNKLNEVGVDCPIFIAKDVSTLPLATPDTFDLAKISKDINDVMKIEENVMSSFTALSCLQNDFQAVTECCAKIDGIARDLADVKTAIAKESRNVISDTSTSEDDVFSDTDADTTFHSGHQTAKDDGTTTDAEDVGTNNDAEDVGTSNG